MIIDLRYHIVSLVAVFLALGIGILVGSTVLGGDTLVKQQEELAGRLEQHLEACGGKTTPCGRNSTARRQSGKGTTTLLTRCCRFW